MNVTSTHPPTKKEIKAWLNEHGVEADAIHRDKNTASILISASNDAFREFPHQLGEYKPDWWYAYNWWEKLLIWTTPKLRAFRERDSKK